MRPYYQQPGVTLYLGDCLEVLKIVPAGSIDMVYADPPYNLSNGGITCQNGRMVSVNKGNWDKSKGLEADHEFTLAWLKACRRVLKDNGTIWVSGTMHNIYSIGFAMQEIGYKLLNDICWYKPNAAPNLSCRYFTHSHETLIWAAKSDKSKHIFNYPEMREAAGGKQMRSLWSFLNNEVEKIPGQKSKAKKTNANLNNMDDLPDIWGILTPNKREKLAGKHPTQKPVALMERIILASTKEGDIVLDPFCGSGTTGLAALNKKREFIGIDTKEEYLKLSIKRLTQA